MKKRKTINKTEAIPARNPVAKFAHRFNRSRVEDDKRQYNRKAKHNHQDVWLLANA
jgi:hypothetical protein